MCPMQPHTHDLSVECRQHVEAELAQHMLWIHQIAFTGSTFYGLEELSLVMVARAEQDSL